MRLKKVLKMPAFTEAKPFSFILTAKHSGYCKQRSRKGEVFSRLLSVVICFNLQYGIGFL